MVIRTAIQLWSDVCATIRPEAAIRPIDNGTSAAWMIAGQPDKVIKKGDSYQVPPGVAHDAKTGAAGARVIATYVVEKGKPLASPAP